MVQFSVRSNVKAFERGLNDFARRQVPFATAQALSRTAEDVHKNTVRSLSRRFDRPTPFTLRGPTVRRARKTRLVASVFFKDIQAGYLELEETGGVRRPKGRALLIPIGTRLNKYGNMPRTAVRRLLARPDTFSGTIRGIGGIWQRKKDGRLKLLVAYEPKASYRPRLHFARDAEKTTRAQFPVHFAREFDKALRTARFPR